MPIETNAGFFSSLLGTGVSADSDLNQEPATYSNKEKNSQTLPLLQANVSSAPILQGKNDKKTNNDNDDIKIESDTRITVSQNALQPTVSHMDIGGKTGTEDFYPDQTSVYVVRKGDSIPQIADLFGVSVNTILSANDLKKGDKLSEGDVLLILPVSGIQHIVTKGQTLQSIAKLYKINASDITMYNGLAENAKLIVGDKLVIPGGEILDEGGDKPLPNLKQSEQKDLNYYAKSTLKAIPGYFINPLPNGRKTQGLHGPGLRGVDIGAPNGSNIYASAPGTVIAIKTGCVVGPQRCGGGYGNMVIVQHSNGTKTLYAHMSKVIAQIGAQVERGDVIGLVGNTGRSTGPHLHFEVFNARNPGADWSWAN